MKFWKSRRSADSIESDSFIERLNAVAIRGRLDLNPHCVTEEMQAPLLTKRRFWSPDELALENGGA